MSSINKILNTALTEGLLEEGNEEEGMFPGGTDAITSYAKNKAIAVRDAAGNAYQTTKENLVPLGVGAASVGAGLGALALIKKMRDKKKKAEEKKKKVTA